VHVIQHEDIPSLSTCFYEIIAQYGTYKSAVPFAETSRGGTPIFKTPQTFGSLNQEVKEHLKVARMFQHLAHYVKKME
jgi:hypothetical protein